MARASYPLDPILAELRQEMGNTILLLNIVITLRSNQLVSNQRRLLPLLRDMLGELRQSIEAVLPAIPEQDDDARSVTHLDH